MKILPPTMRDNKRYLAFELITEENTLVGRDELIRELFSVSGSLLGDLGSSECNIWLFAFDDNKGVISCNRNYVSQTRAVMATITNVKGKRVLVHVLGVSGTVLGATKKYLEGVDVFNPAEQSHINE
ncbi:MAG: ribonuclease protein subunit [Methanolobus sp.]|jgi:ribonuclease P/MRP protein subunit POP5|uniref:Ribonuclease P protein component 2 n=1 Tax=Methanolobus tindarius DSM 2278 TaxID=1090322 RepID=W9DMX5_METTI|nr:MULTISPECIES: Rpp14/Pop5 family protein [Methanolobus]ETA67119.1 RNase P/RNase MRP subunit POP5 [Methanolobus tindarius DSM 2278]MDI3485472.1 ribonuclease protein subunit [Methanolobus sp.]MDK2832801.1 ribonuclease protein subunit [Methanolobus sp.]MDK2939867.1 ribonuclease protein subunit [Methanolobus sp.]